MAPAATTRILMYTFMAICEDTGAEGGLRAGPGAGAGASCSIKETTRPERDKPKTMRNDTDYTERNKCFRKSLEIF